MMMYSENVTWMTNSHKTTVQHSSGHKLMPISNQPISYQILFRQVQLDQAKNSLSALLRPTTEISVKHVAQTTTLERHQIYPENWGQFRL